MADRPGEALRCEGLGVRYGDARVLRDVNLEVRPGRATALIGPNGAGKSTLLLAMAGIRRASEGRAWVGEREVARMSASARADEMAVVLQASPAAFGFTTLELVLMGVERGRSRFSLPGAREVERAMSALAEVECEELASRSAMTLSGGELQRALLARALAGGSPWWMLDEPTSALDPRHELLAMRLMRARCESGGGALAVVHDLNLVEGFFDDVIALREGEVVATGEVSSVLDEALLGELYGAPIRAVRDGERRVWALAR